MFSNFYRKSSQTAVYLIINKVAICTGSRRLQINRFINLWRSYCSSICIRFYKTTVTKKINVTEQLLEPY